MWAQSPQKQILSRHFTYVFKADQTLQLEVLRAPSLKILVPSVINVFVCDVFVCRVGGRKKREGRKRKREKRDHFVLSGEVNLLAHSPVLICKEKYGDMLQRPKDRERSICSDSTSLVLKNF